MAYFYCITIGDDLVFNKEKEAESASFFFIKEH